MVEDQALLLEEGEGDNEIARARAQSDVHEKEATLTLQYNVSLSSLMCMTCAIMWANSDSHTTRST